MTNTTPTWMQFVNFDGRVDGETARALKAAAQKANIEPTELLAAVLRRGLHEVLTGSYGQIDADVKVEPMTINAGNGGFHVVTVVADGYGYLVAEDQNGAEKARVKVDEVHATAEQPEAAHDLIELMREFQKVSEQG